MKKIFYSTACLYAYSFALALTLIFFVGGMLGFRLTADGILPSLSAKLALTPFYWEDSRIGGLSSYLLHPFSFFSIYEIYTGELIVKAALIALLPFALILLFERKALAYFLLPLFYLISYAFNSYTRDTIAAGGFYYYYASMALFFVAQLLDLRIKPPAKPAEVFGYSLSAFFLCIVVYWVNLSVLIFAVPYLFYLVIKGLQNKRFLILNIFAYIPPFLLSRATEIWGKSYTKMAPSFTMPFVMLEKFFFHWNFSNIFSAIILFLSCMALTWHLAALSRPQATPDKRYQVFFTATLLGLICFLLVASQLWYVKINLEGSERYITIWVILIAFLTPLALWEKAASSHAFYKWNLRPDKILSGTVVAANLLFLGLLVLEHKPTPLKIQVESDIENLLYVARDQNANVIMAGGNDLVASYWAVWPVFFHSLETGGSLENAILPIAERCTAILPQINQALSRYDSFKALCLGASVPDCLQRTTECGFFYFDNPPKVLNETQVSYHNQITKVSTLEFTRADENHRGNLLPLLSFHEPAHIVTSKTLHIPQSAKSYLATFGPRLAMAPGDYRLSINCIPTGGHIKDSENLANLKVLFNERDVVFKEVNFTGQYGLNKQSLVFNVPDFKLFTPRVQFLLSTSGKAVLNCDEFQLAKLP